MKRVVTMLASLALLLSVAILPASAAEPTNLLGDQGDMANNLNTTDQSLRNKWFYFVPDDCDATYKIVDVKRADGTVGKAWLADHSKGFASGWTRFLLTNDKVEENTTYVFSAMVKVDGCNQTPDKDGGVGSWLNVYGNDLYLRCQPLGRNDNGVWKRLELEFTTPARADMDGNFALMWSFEATEGYSWAYDFKVFTKEEWDVWAAANPVPEQKPDDTSSKDNTVSQDDGKDEPSSDPEPSVSVNGQKPDGSKADANPSSDVDSEGLSTGAVVGIVAGAVVVLAGAAVAVYFLVIKKKK